MKILLISGHGAGDSGAVGCGYKEADLTRTATNVLAGKIAAYDVSVTRYPVARDAYQDNKNGSLALHLDGYDLVVEVHFNSYNGEAYGTEVLYKPSNMEKLSKKVSAAIASVGLYDRGAKRRTDLANMNLCARKGVPYILIETAFIDNKADMKLYHAKIYDLWGKVADAVCSYYGVKKYASAGGNASSNGWKKEGSDWYYYKNGEPVKEKWEQYKGKWYFLGDDGKMYKHKWLKWKGDWYYLKSDGAMSVSEWQKASNGEWCYLGKDGKMLSDTWLSWKGASYFLKKDGYMAKGNLNIIETFDGSGKWVGGRQA